MIIEDWIVQYPKESIVIIAFVVTLITTLITKYLTDQKRIKELRSNAKEKQALFKEARKEGDLDKVKDIQSKMMEENMELMKHSLKPMIYTAIPFLVLFIWIRNVYDPILAHWIWWYIGAGIASSLVLRKFLKVA